MFAPSVTAAHALRALTVMAREPGRWQLSAEIAAASRVPRPVLAKLLLRLAGEGLLQTRRGPRGGYRITIEGSRTSLLDVIRTVEGEDGFERCQLGLGRCTARSDCALHPFWSEERARLMRLYGELTLERLAAHGGERG